MPVGGKAANGVSIKAKNFDHKTGASLGLAETSTGAVRIEADAVDFQGRTATFSVDYPARLDAAVLPHTLDITTHESMNYDVSELMARENLRITYGFNPDFSTGIRTPSHLHLRFLDSVPAVPRLPISAHNLVATKGIKLGAKKHWVVLPRTEDAALSSKGAILIEAKDLRMDGEVFAEEDLFEALVEEDLTAKGLYRSRTNSFEGRQINGKRRRLKMPPP